MTQRKPVLILGGSTADIRSALTKTLSKAGIVVVHEITPRSIESQPHEISDTYNDPEIAPKPSIPNSKRARHGKGEFAPLVQSRADRGQK